MSSVMPFQEIDDNVIEADFKDLIKAKEKDFIPEPPYWYKPERSAPDIGEITGLAQAERSDHALRVTQAALFEMRLGLETSAVFERDVDLVKINEIEQWQSPLLRNEHDALLAFIESQTLQPKSRRRSLADAEESATKEDYVLECWDDWSRVSLISGDGSLMSALAYDATVHGMWAVYLCPDPGNYRTGQRYRRVDPKTVFPVFEGDRGLGHVYQVFDAQAKDMLAWYGDGGGPLTKRIRDMARTGSEDRVDLTMAHEAICWWGRTWAIVSWGGKIIRKWRHNMHRPPWVILPFAWSRMGSSQTITPSMAGGLWGEPMAPNDQGNLSIASTRQRDLAKMYAPFLITRLPLQDAMEKIASRLMTAVRVARNPPMVWQRPIQYGNKPMPETQPWEGGVTEVPELMGAGRPLEALPTLPVAEAMEPLMQFITTAMQASIPMPLLQGASLAAQSSGSAIDVLMQAGYDKWIPVLKGIQLGSTEVSHTMLLNIKEWGRTMGPDANGSIDVPRRMMDPYGLESFYKLTPEMLDRTDCYIDVTLARFNLQGMLQAATTIATIRNQVGVMSKREAIELLAYTNNVERSIQERRDEELDETPGVLEAMTLEHLYEALYVAYVKKDMESVRRIAIRGRRVAARQKLADMQLAAMGGGGDFGAAGIPPGGDVSPDGTPIPPGGDAQSAGAGAATPMLSPGDLGNGVGNEGGAPSQMPAVMPQ
jgi:hypothetical protein